MYIGLHVKYLLVLTDFNQTWTFSTIFAIYSNIKLHDTPSGGSTVVPCRWVDGHTRRSWYLLIATLQTCLKSTHTHTHTQVQVGKNPMVENNLKVELW